MSTRLPLLLLLVGQLGCGDVVRETGGGNWIGNPIADRPAEPPPLPTSLRPQEAPVATQEIEDAPARPLPRRRRAAGKAPSAETVGFESTPLSAASDASVGELLKTAEAQAAAGQMLAALASARAALAKTPKDPAVHIRVAQLLLKSGRNSDAAEGFAEALRLDPQNLEAIYGNAVSLLRLDDLTGARRLITRLETLRPGHVAIRELRAVAEARSGNTNTAVKNYAKVAAAKPDDPRVQAQYGRALAKAGNFGKAAQALAVAARAKPDDPQLQFELGTALAQAGQLNQAEVALIRSARTGNSVDAWRNLAALRERKGDVAGAVAAWKKIAKRVPKSERTDLRRRLDSLRRMAEQKPPKKTGNE